MDSPWHICEHEQKGLIQKEELSNMNSWVEDDKTFICFWFFFGGEGCGGEGKKWFMGVGESVNAALCICEYTWDNVTHILAWAILYMHIFTKAVL